MSNEVRTIIALDDTPAIIYSNNVPALTYIDLGEIELYDEGNDLLAIKPFQIEIYLQPLPSMETDLTP